MVENLDKRRPALELKLNAEAESVLRSPVFSRSPVLSKLLRFLVDETLAGRGDNLKSYAVAVDGLGRPETFDPASDSSARVQMVRLRHALENHYAHYGPVDDQCLYLQPASYKVRLAKLAVAYPLLFRPLSEIVGQPMQSPAGQHIQPPIDDPARSSRTDSVKTAKPGLKIERRHRFLLLGLFAGITIAFLTWSGWQHFNKTDTIPVSPILEISAVEGADTKALDQTSKIVSSIFASDLPKFKTSRVRVVSPGVESLQLVPNDEVYRLLSNIDEDVNGGQRLYLRLTDARTNIAFWSDEILLSDDAKTVPDALSPLIAEINGPFGAIASHGLTLYRDRNDAGYACLLKYYSFVQTRATNIEEAITACFKKPVAERRLKATVLAAHALFTIERSSAMQDFGSATDSAVRLARAAVDADPNDGMANFAMARISYLQNDCVSARFYTGRAVESNSRSPLILANLAALAPMCNYLGTKDLLDRAFLVQSDLYPRGRLLLVLAALEQGRPEKVAEIKPSNIPQSEFSQINYYLAETLIAGAQGKRELTARSWKRFVAVQPLKSRNPDVLLGQIIIMPRLRRKLVGILQRAGAFEN